MSYLSALSLKIKLPLSIVVIVAIIFAILTGFMLYNFQSVVDSVKNKHLLAAAHDVGESVATRFSQASRDMVMTASLPNVLQAVGMPPESLAKPEQYTMRANLKVLFERILLAYGYYNSFYLVNEVGEFIVGTRPLARDLTKGEDSVPFKAAMQKHGFSTGPTLYVESKNRVIIPIFLEVVYNGYGGALVSSINVTKVVETAMQEVVHSEIGYLVMGFDDNSFLEVSRSEGVKLPLGPWTEELRGKTSGVLDIVVDGKGYTLGFYRVPHGDIYSISVAKDDYMLGPATILRNTALLANAFALLAIMLCVYYFTKPFTRDIANLSKFAKAVTEGRDDITISTARNDEIGNLAVSLSKMVEALKEMVINSESATKAKSDFLARMSHEIRTPMNGILGMTYLAMQANPDAKQLDYLNRIDTAAKTLLGVINDILDFSKIEAGKMEINNVTFRISGVLASMRDMLEPKSNEKHLNLKFTVADDVPDVIYSDPLRFAQICINLCSNAIKFTAEGEVHMHIAVSERQMEHVTLLVMVQDSGIGMDVESQQSIFESFSQADGTTTRKYGGTGLGLAISRSLTHLLGGEIWVESVLDKGSKFFFTMQASEGFESDLEEKEVKPSIEYSVPDLKILLVEDNEINQMIATEILNNMGARVSLANNGLEAISAWEDGDFDLILMDIQMPHMDGLTAAEEIRKSSNPLSQSVPIIAMTAHAMSGDREKSIQAGMNDHITKPINIDELYSVLIFWGTAIRSENSLG